LIDSAQPSGSAAPSSYLPSRSPAMSFVEQMLVGVADAGMPVLLLGEEGCGKRALAKFIHDTSSRRLQPFAAVNGGEISVQGLAERIGREGTVYIQAVQELGPNCQTALLEACVNGNGDGRGNTRLIAGAVQDLEFAVRCGHFREDLFYRVSGISSRVPPLRHRKEDILGLAEFFLDKYSSELGLAKPDLTGELRCFLLEHSWTGNITELKQVTKVIMALGSNAEALVGLRSLLSHHSASRGNAQLSLKQAARRASKQAERELILEVLSRTRWNRKRAAEELQISYKALLYKLKEIGFEEHGR
jgi:two-component system, NtrC family, response regulator AtoC